ncbi:hypothetical protein EDC04DRAFT_2760736 [Pisolithus marmoratus]|nr:hypothetical protein EDC04DRAFT_2760736 [Pisolithus marmoratus]
MQASKYGCLFSLLTTLHLASGLHWHVPMAPVWPPSIWYPLEQASEDAAYSPVVSHISGSERLIHRMAIRMISLWHTVMRVHTWPCIN